MAFLNAIKTKLKRLNTKIEDSQEVITFSEAGIHDHNEHHTMTCAESESRNLVVATHESRFSDDMISYTLEMAKRMGYGIIAVNAANLTHDVTEFFSTTHEEIFSDFKETAVKNIVSFQNQAAELGLKFAHTIKFSNIDHAIEDIIKECGEIEFIISENKETTRARGEIRDEDRIAKRLCVYSMN